MAQTSIKTIGHRGAAGLAPENTLAAIQKALELKVDRIEIDVHQTADNEVIVLHDISLERTTTGAGEVKKMKLAEIKQFSAGAKFGKEFQSEKVPTLSEVLALINGKIPLIIEIKYGNSYYPNIEKNVLAIVNQHNAKSWCIVHSFKDEVLENIYKLDNTFILHKLFIARFFYNLKKNNYISEYSVNYHFVNKRLVKRVHALGKKINVWTVNEPKLIAKMKRLGVDGIITNFPNIVLSNK